VPANAQAVIIVPSLVADRYIQFTPVYRGGAALKDGSTLSLSSTAVPVELDDANAAVNDLTKALGPQGANANGSLSKLLSTSAQTLDGQGSNFKQTLQDLSDVSRILSDNRGNATQTVQNLAKITQAMAASDRQIRSFSQNLASVSSTLNAQKAELRAAVKSLAVALREVSNFVKQNKAEIASNVQGLAQITGVLVKEKAALQQFLDKAPVAASNALGVYDARGDLRRRPRPRRVFVHAAGLPTASEIALTREPGKHRMLILNWKPDDGKTWRQVAAGAMDAQIAREAAYLKTHFTKKFWLVIHHEPEDEVKTQAGSGYTAEDYRAMFRHVVSQFRARGSRNVLFTMVYMGYSGYMIKPWFRDLYPGDAYVDWIGFDPFAKSNIKDYPGLLNKVAEPQQQLGFPGFYDYANKYFPNKPLMLSEWAVLETPGDPGRKPAFYRNVAAQFANYPRIKALAYYNARHAENMPDGGNTSIDATPSALRAFKALGKRPEFNIRR
jgi:virulence factor Mce-like protein